MELWHLLAMQSRPCLPIKPPGPPCLAPCCCSTHPFPLPPHLSPPCASTPLPFSSQVACELYLNLRYQGTDVAVMTQAPPGGDYASAFAAMYQVGV